MYMINLGKQDLRWLQKAFNKKDFRDWIKNILVVNGYAYATNGHVIHKLKCAEEEISGSYDFNGIKIDDDLKLQDKISKMFNGFNDECGPLTLMFDRLNTLKLNDNLGIDLKYFNNATDKADNIVVKLHDNKDRIYLHYENREAIIMCVNLKFQKGNNHGQ